MMELISSTNSIRCLKTCESNYSESQKRQNFDESRLDSRDSQSSSSSQEVDEFFKRKCLKYIIKMMNWFMMQNNHSFMQWMLNLRMYELKIHYNIISEDHINWMKDQILYKSIQFNMSEFWDMIYELMRETRCMLMKDLIFENDDFNTLRISW